MPHRFLHDDVLLSTETARSLYHDVVAGLPIVDLHNHLAPADIVRDRVFETLTELWLEDDHYKWRAMRLAGVDERLVTGDADPWERFEAWATTVPGLVRNPLYVWTHLELRRVFGIDLPLSRDTAGEIWVEANRQLPVLSARTLLARFGVVAIATTDDPGDDLVDHETLKEVVDAPLMIPTFRPDAAYRLLGDPASWRAWADRLGSACGVAVVDLDSLLDALTRAQGRFLDAGGRASDHGLGCLPDVERSWAIADEAIRRIRVGDPVDSTHVDAVALEVVVLSARLAAESDGVLQLHLGARRNISPSVYSALGPDVGADAVDDARQGPGLVRLLQGLERERILPRTVLYNANPADDTLFASTAGAFSRADVAPLIQWGPPWWFNDHEDGIRRQLEVISHNGRLAGFMGMVTDSRSLLSMTRHELFRRILCDVLGHDVEAGLVPADDEFLAELVRDVCARNAKTWFGLVLT